MIFHSAFEYSYLWLPVIGFTIGLFASMTGSGGGVFFLLFLVVVFKVPAQTAVATSLAATLPICIIGSLGHHRLGYVNLKLGLIFIITGIVGAVLGATLTNLLTSDQLKTGFGIFAILLALQIWLNNRKQKETINDNPQSESNRKNISKGSFYGFLAGIVTGTFGTSGAAPVMAGLLALRLPVKIVIGTSMLIVLVNTVSGLAAHFVVGEVDLTLVYFLTFGSLIGAFSGPKVLAGIKTGKAEVAIRRWYALALIVIGIIMIVN